MQITVIILIIAVGVIVGVSGTGGASFLTTFLAAFGLFVIVALGAAIVFIKKKNAKKGP
ncbi:hypothetical protein [Paraglaciecola polaris]|tara:strand:- start:4304 stop:4480 length:177 start_codon:yes stop_codon:yes gene_type:complete